MSAITPIATLHTRRTTTINRYLRAEWTKLRTLRSTWRTTAFAATLALSFTVLVDLVQVSQWHSQSAQQRSTFDPTSASLFGMLFAATLLGALAVRSVTKEYSTGMIRTTFSAMPSRQRVLAAKAVSIAAFVFPIALVCDFVSFELGQRIFTSKHIQVALTHPGVPRAILFGAIAVSLVAVIGVGLGGVIRHTAGATTTLVLIIIASPWLGQLLPASVGQYLPGTAVQAAVTGHRASGLLTPDAAIAVLCAYAAIALTAAMLRVTRNDA